MNRLAIMVITWNNFEDSIECLESLLKQSQKNLTLLSIDNNSTDDSAEKLRQFIASKPGRDVQFLETGYNGGTAGGFNAGIKWAMDNDYDYIGTLNADAIADKDWVKQLVDELDTHPQAGMATGLLLRRDGKTIDTSGDFYTTWGLPGPRNRNQKREAAPQQPGSVFGSTGGGFIARTDMFRKIGLFDEKFFMYYEDVDISFRAQLQGYIVRYTPKAFAFHKLGASSKTVPGLAVYNTFKNIPMLFAKNVPMALWPIIYPRFVLLYSLILGNAIIKGRGKYALKGMLKSWLYAPYIFKERRKIQGQRSVTSRYISSITLHDLPPDQTGLRKFRKIFTGK